MVGSRVAHYEVIAKIGAGGMGEVYHARDLKLQREVAIKILSTETPSLAGEKERLKREARTLAALNHPNIVTVYSVEEDQGVEFVTMELLEGESLDAILRNGAVTQERFFNLSAQLLEAMQAAHRQGIVHRDLKPTNIMITAEGRLKVLDFGIAKILPELATKPVSNEQDSTRLLTQPGLIQGTIGFFSPEQAQGQAVDHRSDIFSVGIILYQLCTSKHPFPGPTAAAVIASIMRDPPRPIESNESWVQAIQPIIERCVRKHPDDRYQAISEIIDDLKSALHQPVVPIATAAELMQTGREALARHAWAHAYQTLQQAESQAKLGPDVLQQLAEAAWWTGRTDECCELLKRAYAGYLDDKQPRRASLMALKLADLFLQRASRSVSAGWLKQAERLLQNEEDSVEYGYLLRFKTVLALEVERDTESALRFARQSFDIGKTAEDKDLVALSTQDQGRILVDQGHVSEGMALLDEAMAAVLSEELNPLTVARTYCNVISVCERTADFRRAAEWTDEASNWCEPHSSSPFPGICSVHRAEILRLRGSLDEAEREARQVCADSRGYTAVAAAAFYEIAEIKLRTGDFDGAEEAFREAHQRGYDPVPGLPLLLLAQGKTDNARTLITRALGGLELALDRAKLLPAHINISLAARDIESAQASVAELESIAGRYGSVALRAAATEARGNLNLANGDFGGASTNLQRALALWLEIELPYEAAVTRTLLAQAFRGLGDEASAELETHAARTTFAKLGAHSAFKTQTIVGIN